MTGMSFMAVELNAKRLELLRDINHETYAEQPAGGQPKVYEGVTSGAPRPIESSESEF